MILESILNLLYTVVTTVFGVLPSIPSFDGLTSSIDLVMNTIFNNLQLLGVFVRPQTIMLIVPVFLVIENFENIYFAVLWVLKKIPMIGIE